MQQSSQRQLQNLTRLNRLQQADFCFTILTLLSSNDSMPASGQSYGKMSLH